MGWGLGASLQNILQVDLLTDMQAYSVLKRHPLARVYFKMAKFVAPPQIVLFCYTYQNLTDI